MACKNCGSIIQDGLTICPVCHANLSQEVTNTTNVQNQVMQTPNNIQTDLQINEENKQLQDKVTESTINNKVIIIIILAALVAIIIVLFLFGVFKFNNGNTNKNTGGRDIKTVNDETEAVTKKQKTTTTSQTTIPVVVSGEDIHVYGDKYTVPNGFDYKDETSNGKVHYLMRSVAGAIIAFDLVKGEDITIDTFLTSVVNTYESNKVDVTVSQLQEKDGFKYYEIIQKDETNKKDVKEHMEVLVELSDGAIFECFMLNTTAYGKQNYLSVLFDFIKSREIGEGNVLTNTKPSFGVAGNEI